MHPFRFWPWLAAILSGLLLTLCFPRWDQGWLCWVALTPLIAALWLDPKASLKRAALLGYVTGLCFFWGVFSWLTTVTVAGWFLLPFYLALFPAAWAAFLSAISRTLGDFTRSGANLRIAVLGAAAWVALEWLRGLGALSFGWNGLGIALHRNLALIQITEFTGVGGLSFLVALTNLTAVITVRRFWNEAHGRRLRPHWDFSANMALLALAFSFGVRTVFAPNPGDSMPLRVAAVQANIPQEEKFDAAHAKKVCEQYADWTEAALVNPPQLLLWPEAATPGDLNQSEEMIDFVRGFAQRDGVNFLLGTLDFDLANHESFNIVALFTPEPACGSTPQTYRKMHLVPFGEYIPFRRAFPPFEWIIGDLVPGDFTPGTEYTVLQLHQPEVKAAALVCFEDTLGDLTRRFVQRGAQLLVNVTNDGWFRHSAGAEQHLANSVFRAVENRRPLVRCANTGVTAFINSHGRVTDRLDPFTEGFQTRVVQIPPATARQTFYTRQGERFSQFCAGLSLATLGFVYFRRSPKK